MSRILPKAENTLAVAALLLMATLPVAELSLRSLFDRGFAGSAELVQHLTLWVAFLGAALASRERRHLGLAASLLWLPATVERPARIVSAVIAATVALGLAWASFRFVQSEFGGASRIAGWIPAWVVEAVLPLSFVVIAVRFAYQAGTKWDRAIAALSLPLAALIGIVPEPFAAYLVWPGITILILSLGIGVPIFVVLGGMALLLFFGDGVPVAAVPVETYRMVVSPTLPAVPLFTLAGFILASGGASTRLVRLFRALFGWMPGGLVIATTLVCAFFSTFTGASGVTIMALGGLLLPVLVRNGYGDRFATGLLTSTGSIGLLFPPSLAVILYGVVARVPINDLFVAGIVPGLLMVGAICLYGLFEGRRAAVERTPFDAREALAAILEARWEVLLPFVVLYAIFGGFASLIEASAITAVYATVTEIVIHRDIHPTRALPKVLVNCVTMLGGVFVILGVAMGLTNYMVDAMIPMRAAEWVAANVDSRILFLLTLNLFLLIVGAVMDIFSAIVVVVPLILPISRIFGIDPLHLGMIFLVNLELGYLTPPVGMNLFLASYRLERPLVEIYRSTLPFLFVLLAVVLIVTYVPALIIGVE